MFYRSRPGVTNGRPLVDSRSTLRSERIGGQTEQGGGDGVTAPNATDEAEEDMAVDVAPSLQRI